MAMFVSTVSAFFSIFFKLLGIVLIEYIPVAGVCGLARKKFHLVRLVNLNIYWPIFCPPLPSNNNRNDNSFRSAEYFA
jgi:hypothetical protein